MAGIYLHIPFCESRCIYCNFYSTTQQENLKERYVSAICNELHERKAYLKGEDIHTIYIGGGTPSQLSIEQLQIIFEKIKEEYNLSSCEEITIEANPDDLTPNYIIGLKTLPVNRISMGIQTFNDKALKFLNRRHDAEGAIRAINLCKEAGFLNFSIDLIYGLPGETLQQWEEDITKALQVCPSHISAYCLSYEKGTPLYRMMKEGKIAEIDDDTNLAYYTLLINKLKDAGYEHYEISNFCLPGRSSRHNSSYWQGVPYLGCGAAAHSYNGEEREWNVANIEQYVSGIESKRRNYEKEELDVTTRYNEMIMTRLRTSIGLDLHVLKELFGKDMYNYCLQTAEPYIKSEQLMVDNKYLRLTEKGIFTSDYIISDLFFVVS
jgi:oxygen-independent coproporphyrinogen-3 oxidase